MTTVRIVLELEHLLYVNQIFTLQIYTTQALRYNTNKILTF